MTFKFKIGRNLCHCFLVVQCIDTDTSADDNNEHRTPNQALKIKIWLVQSFFFFFRKNGTHEHQRFMFQLVGGIAGYWTTIAVEIVFIPLDYSTSSRAILASHSSH